MRLVCLSDTHGRHRELTVPPGDVLIHAGDLTRRGRAHEIADFNDWLATLPHSQKMVIAGNHDFLFESEPQAARALLTAATYLEDSGVSYGGMSFWGSPVSPRFFNWAFNRDRGTALRHHWELIPADTDVLITHTPAQGWLDRTWTGQRVGCADLRQTLEAHVHPLLMICGHIHEAAGYIQHENRLILNACSLDRHYRPRQAIWTVDLDPVARKILAVASG
ncbi:MAG: metallophosphatase domain-containing protein [Candidatus Sericytochromatia bacterium]